MIISSGAGGQRGPAACAPSPRHPQATHADATAVGDKLEDAQGLHAVRDVEVEVVLALESAETVGDEDGDDNDYIQQVVAILPIVDGVHVELHAELGAVDGHKDQLGDLRGCRGSEGQARLQSPIVPPSPSLPVGCAQLGGRVLPGHPRERGNPGGVAGPQRTHRVPDSLPLLHLPLLQS